MKITTARVSCDRIHPRRWIAVGAAMWMLAAVALLGCARIEAAPARSVAEFASFSRISASADTTLGMYDAVMAQRGQVQFAVSCAHCHTKPNRQKPQRGLLSFTKLRDLWRHPPYFVDGSAATLVAVVEHYDGSLNLGLSKAQQGDLVEYLKSR